MNLHDRLRALCGEYSEEYILVTKHEGTIAFATSSIEFADEQIPNLSETVDGWKKQEKARDLRHHHDKPLPKKESSTENQPE